MKVSVRVTANAKKALVTRISDQSLAVKVDAPAVNNKANLRLIAILAEYFNVPQSRILLMGGVHSREKLIEVVGL